MISKGENYFKAVIYGNEKTNGNADFIDSFRNL